ncbi:DUF6944 family repetitive protein [Sporolactobacillus vineae]|uniref:DUF6944 family repetitive protein n=1 Tax=Sporolactobacillus vineae TaxID=444463 RepID=UPI000289927B|nr:hypothetical protein [Sporolactobacillus vineae]
MNEKEAAASYALLGALGTATAALGATPTIRLTKSVKTDLSIIGNALQAASSGLQANISDTAPGIYGNGLQSAGNTLVIYGLIGDTESDFHQRVQITGNWFQALGGSYALKPNFDSEERNLDQALTVIGGLMQVIGNSLQAVSGTFSLRQVMNERDTNAINATGSWIQAAGASLEFLVSVRQS